MKKYTNEQRIEAIEQLTRAGVNQSSQIYAVLRKVSASGNSRQVSYFVVKDNNLFNITFAVGVLSSQPLTTSGDIAVKITGCGMDMCFEALYNVGNVENIADFRELAQTYRMI